MLLLISLGVLSCIAIGKAGQMGFVYAIAKVTNIMGGDGSYTMPFLVDTGATDTIIPSDELDKLGIKRESKRNYELADGTIASYDIGYAFICVNGEKVAANVVFGKENSEPFLSVAVLESAGFVVDPVRQVLRKTAAIPLK